jgi:hypothetical protein
MRKILGLSLAALMLCAGTASATIINVPGDQATIHAGVQAASAGDTVLVAAGTYTDCTHETEGAGSTPACVIMKTGVTLIGAGMDDTIIDVQSLGRGIFVELVSDVRIENLQVRNAFAEVYGGGILLRQVDDTVVMADLKIQANTDGGIICINSASPIMRRIEFIGNAAKQGGGLAIEETSNAQCYDSNFDGNSSPSGGGLIMRADSNAIIDGCTFVNNYTNAAFGNGGAIAIISSSPTLTNLDIQNNDTQGYGGGVAYMSGSGGSFTSSVVANNTASYTYGLGGGIHTDGSNPTLEYLQIYNNSASGVWAEGGGINVNYGPSPTIRNCSIVSNQVGDNGLAGGIAFQWNGDATIENCIVANNAKLGLYCISSNPSIACSDVWGNGDGDALCGTDAGGNFSLDPQFCVPVGFRDVAALAIATDSPCMPGNHPDGAAACGGALIGADGDGCGTSADGLAPGMARLVGNAPNPFNPKTTIFFVLDEPGVASIRVYDLAGRSVAAIPMGDLAAGQHQVDWNGRSDNGEVMASGVYFYTLDALGESHSRRMILVK